MSVIDKWLDLHRQDEEAATFATSATNSNTTCDASSLDVASDLLQAATFPRETENVAKCSNPVATGNLIKDQSLTGNVADVANVAREEDSRAHVANVAASTGGSAVVCCECGAAIAKYRRSRPS